jgi:hypothetical protein
MMPLSRPLFSTTQKLEPVEADFSFFRRIKRILRELLVLFTDRQSKAGQIHLPVL